MSFKLCKMETIGKQNGHSIFQSTWNKIFWPKVPHSDVRPMERDSGRRNLHENPLMEFLIDCSLRGLPPMKQILGPRAGEFPRIFMDMWVPTAGDLFWSHASPPAPRALPASPRRSSHSEAKLPGALSSGDCPLWWVTAALRKRQLQADAHPVPLGRLRGIELPSGIPCFQIYFPLYSTWVIKLLNLSGELHAG